MAFKFQALWFPNQQLVSNFETLDITSNIPAESLTYSGLGIYKRRKVKGWPPVTPSFNFKRRGIWTLEQIRVQIKKKKLYHFQFITKIVVQISDAVTYYSVCSMQSFKTSVHCALQIVHC